MLSEQNISDEQLVLSAAKGNLKAFEQIVHHRYAWVWNLAYRFLGQKEDAEDIVQKAFIMLLKASGRYQGTALFMT